jgi:hypothetical protein
MLMTRMSIAMKTQGLNVAPAAVEVVVTGEATEIKEAEDVNAAAAVIVTEIAAQTKRRRLLCVKRSHHPRRRGKCAPGSVAPL